ncbi:DUF4031 domain-containing protein [Nesterenkonia cremea]|uniref:DUF4031 domain-containing protein n=1 Tax=Nesterenkonia cremea TaxID=1882340 RepID=A0A917AWA9_9MICC|nr:DUF4031 domain-containing protein [Nesterenkonia cremea]GGE75455.1 hypothetical protein GCM10011401_23460 [Nesterenkonia cremea]
MTLYIDPPVWPAHGTLFSHLISDESLAELHDFAAASGISERAFDEDHYDVPEFRHPELVARGAVPVSGNELARILTRSGLRVRSRDRSGKVRPRLSRAWSRLGGRLLETPATPAEWEDLGEGLLLRWSEHHRSYHALPHLAAVLHGVALLERHGECAAEQGPALLLAAWYHDAVYAGTAGEDEEASARLAEDQLSRMLPDHLTAETARLVRLTASHSPEEGDHSGAVLVDADLEVLGRERALYRRYAQQVRQDYAHVPEEQFRAGRAQVLQRLLEAPPLFRTTTGRRLWEGQARNNMEQELRELTSG